MFTLIEGYFFVQKQASPFLFSNSILNIILCYNEGVKLDLSSASTTCSTPSDIEPGQDELKQLLPEIQANLAEVLAQKEALQQVTITVSFTVQPVTSFSIAG